jgi:hypothetical protein
MANLARVSLYLPKDLNDLPRGETNHHPALVIPGIRVFVNRKDGRSSSGIEKSICFGYALFELPRSDIGKVGLESAYGRRR